MQYTAATSTNTHRLRRVTGTLALALGATLGVTGLGAVGLSSGMVAAQTPTQTVPLNNTEAPTENTPECPNAVDDFWHFVIAGGQGYSFVSITLMLGEDSVTFSGAQIILNPNNLKPDNVYVRVPDGYEFADLVKAGSSAQITPATGSVNFVLSHFCDGPGSTTTTSSSTTSSTTTSTTSSTTTSSTTTTTIDDTTTTSLDDTTTTSLDDTTTTSLDDTTTTSLAASGTTVVAQQGPVTTQTGNAGGNVPPTAVELPRTGGDTTVMALIGGLLVAFGVAMVSTTRRRPTV